MLLDEAPKLGNSKIDWRFTQGESSIINPHEYNVLEVCMKVIGHDGDLLKLMRDLKRVKALHRLSSQEYRNLFALPIAEELYRHFKIEVQHKSAFIAYMTSKSLSPPQWLQERKDFALVALCRGVICELLTLALSRKVDVEYGEPHDPYESGEQSVPYGANMDPSLTSTISLHYETFIKTFIMLFLNGLKDRQVRKLLTTMLEMMRDQAKKLNNISQDKTAAYHELSQWLPGVDLLNTDLHTPEIYDTLRWNGEVILYYVRACVKDKIFYWKNNICINFMQVCGLFDSVIGMSATFYNRESLPSYMKMQGVPGTIGHALDIIKKKCLGVHELLLDDGPQGMLLEILFSFFPKGSKATSLLDPKGQLQGLKNFDVALTMARFFKKERPEIEYLLYFDKVGKEDLMMALEVATEVVKPVDQCKVTTENSVIYNNHSKCEGVNQPSKGHGVMIVGDEQALFELVQAAFRPRGVVLFKRLLGIEGETVTPEELAKLTLEQTQALIFVMSKSVRQHISAGRKAILDDIFEYTIDNENRLVAEHNYANYRREIFSIVFIAVFDKILFSGDIRKQIQIAKEFKHILLTEIEVDPIKLFGFATKLENTKELLSSYRNQVNDLIKHCGFFTAKEKQQIQDKIEAVRLPSVLPDKTPVMVDEKGNIHEIQDSLGKETCHEHTNNHEHTKEEEKVKEVENQLQQQSQTGSYEFTEGKWPKTMDLTTLDWLKVDSKPIEGPPLFSCRSLLNKAYGPVSENFDTRLWMTNNFVPQVLRKVAENEVMIGSYQQRPLFEMLVIAKKDAKGKLQIVSMGALALCDAVAWREFLRQKTLQGMKSEYIYFLFCQENDAPVAGDEVDLFQLREHEDFQILVGQLQLLNGNETYDKRLLYIEKWMRKHDLPEVMKLAEKIYVKRRRKGNFPDTPLGLFIPKTGN